MTNLEDLRIRLDQATERIVSRLKDRSRLPLNPQVYVPDAVQINGRYGISLLQFAIEGMEAYHASLGRYEYSDQYPIISTALPKSATTRTGTDTELSEFEIKVSEELLEFYRSVLPGLCQKGDEPKSYGETVYIDADLLELMHERVNTIGRYVAQSKYDRGPEILQHADNPDAVRAMLRDVKREDNVIERVKESAVKYSLKTEVAESVFRWLMKETLDVEVLYLQAFARKLVADKTKSIDKG